MAEADQAAPGDDNSTVITAERVYLKDASFEAPNSPEIFQTEWSPKLSVEITQNTETLAEHTYDVLLTLTATAKVGDKTAFLAEVHQGGIFFLRGIEQENLEHILNVFCPRTLYPYACAQISDMALRGGFPQLLLAPISFEALYQQRKAQEAGEQQ